MSKKLIRLDELITAAKDVDDFFDEFDEEYETHADIRKHFDWYNDAFMCLDVASWHLLKEKSLQYYTDHRNGQHKQGFFNQLNEAFAYKYLHDSGYNKITAIAENSKVPTPDIQYWNNDKRCFCEVKTLGISDAEIKRRKIPEVTDYTEYATLSEGFLAKFKSNVERAKKQIEDYSNSSDGIVFQMMIFDDFTNEYLPTYKQQLLSLTTKYNLGKIEFYDSYKPVAIVHLN